MDWPGRARWALAVVLALLLGAGACGGEGADSTERRLDDQEVEQLLLERQTEQRRSLRFTNPSCPSDIPAREGDTFECTLEVDGQTARYRVTVTEVLGERARYEFRPLQAIIEPFGLAVFVQGQLEEPWNNAQVNCGLSKIRIVDVGTVIECTAFDGTDTRHIQAVVEDSDGTVTLREP